jgi:hypothetical protein
MIPLHAIQAFFFRVTSVVRIADNQQVVIYVTPKRKRGRELKYYFEYDGVGLRGVVIGCTFFYSHQTEIPQ